MASVINGTVPISRIIAHFLFHDERLNFNGDWDSRSSGGVIVLSSRNSSILGAQHPAGRAGRW